MYRIASASYNDHTHSNNAIAVLTVLAQRFTDSE